MLRHGGSSVGGGRVELREDSVELEEESVEIDGS